MRNLIYFDNASTSFPKPQKLLDEISSFVNEVGASPGRGSYPSAQKAHVIIEDVRQKLAQILGVHNAEQIAFTHNATHASNTVIKGLLKSGDHVIISNFEHNAVYRPIHQMSVEKIISYDVWESNEEGAFDLKVLEALIKPNTKLIALNHASNVLGVLSPVLDVSQIAKKHQIPLLVDVAQTAGLFPTLFGDIADYMIGTAHKSLLGPSGVGFLYTKDSDTLRTLYEGGSGNHSASAYHPEYLPAKFEAGTCNYLGIAGLKGSLDYLSEYGVKKMRHDILEYTKCALEMLQEIPGVTVYGPKTIQNKAPVISFNVEGYFSSEVSHILQEHSICVRTGIQCAPLIHKTIKTMPHGTVRLSFGHLNSYAELQTVMNVLKNLQKD
jgi:cysteine desulfurase family protein